MSVSWVVFHLTDRCQLDCRHCLRDPGQRPLDLPLALITKVLDEAHSVYRCGHVGFTGGEPTLHPELEAILEAVASRGMTWHLVSNGGGRFERLAELLDARPALREGMTALDFSLDGADEATHDRIRGAGTFRGVMAAVARCSAARLPFVLQMTLNALNEGQIEAMGLLASQLGAQRLSMGMTQATGSAHDADLHLPASQWRQIHDRILRLGETLRIPVMANEGFSRPQPFHVCEPFRSEILHVDPLGRLSLCCSLSGVPGDGGEPEVFADLNNESLVSGHRRMLAAIRSLQEQRLPELEAGNLGEWDHFPCNVCLRRHGKPYWTDQGSAGPRAKRLRRPERP